MALLPDRWFRVPCRQVFLPAPRTDDVDNVVQNPKRGARGPGDAGAIALAAADDVEVTWGESISVIIAIQSGGLESTFVPSLLPGLQSALMSLTHG